MARAKISSLAVKAKRLAFPISKKPRFESLGDGISLGYRRNQSAGTWIARRSDGKGGSRQERIGLADDYVLADGESVLTFAQAQSRALAGPTGARAKHISFTVSRALDAYEADLRLRNADPANVARLRHNLPAALLERAVGSLVAHDLSDWRDSLSARLQPATVNRTINVLKASLNLAAERDERIENRHAWEKGLKTLPDASVPRNVIIPDDLILFIVTAAYELSPRFGLLVEVAATTGGRYSQIAALRVCDLQDDPIAPRLMLPSAKKGRGVKRVTHRPVPIPSSLARRLRENATGRDCNEPLLRKDSGDRWRRSDHTRLFARAVRGAAIKKSDDHSLDLGDLTIYALRHSSITRQLLRGTPVRVVAVHHDTSVQMIERNYSALLADHADAIARSALLDLGL